MVGDHLRKACRLPVARELITIRCDGLIRWPIATRLTDIDAVPTDKQNSQTVREIRFPDLAGAMLYLSCLLQIRPRQSFFQPYILSVITEPLLSEYAAVTPAGSSQAGRSAGDIHRNYEAITTEARLHNCGLNLRQS